VITVTGFILLYQGNIKACGFGNTFKLNCEFLRQGHQNFKSGFCFPLWHIHFLKEIL